HAWLERAHCGVGFRLTAQRGQDRIRQLPAREAGAREPAEELGIRLPCCAAGHCREERCVGGSIKAERPADMQVSGEITADRNRSVELGNDLGADVVMRGDRYTSMSP